MGTFYPVHPVIPSKPFLLSVVIALQKHAPFASVENVGAFCFQDGCNAGCRMVPVGWRNDFIPFAGVENLFRVAAHIQDGRFHKRFSIHCAHIIVCPFMHPQSKGLALDWIWSFFDRITGFLGWGLFILFILVSCPSLVLPVCFNPLPAPNTPRSKKKYVEEVATLKKRGFHKEEFGKYCGNVPPKFR